MAILHVGGFRAKNVFDLENLNLGMNMMFDFGEMYAVQGVQVFVKYQLSHLRKGL